MATIKMVQMSFPFWRGFAAISLAIAAACAQAAEPVPLRLIAFNDFHGNLESTGLSLTLTDPDDAQKTLRLPVGGAAALAGLVSTLRAGAPHSLVLSGGDLFGASPLVSTLFRHESTVDVMNQLGLEVGTLGNHEFDAGLGELKRLVGGGCAENAPDAATTSCAAEASYRGAKFAVLGANVIAKASGKPEFAPYVIKRYGGIPVGIIGAVTKTTPHIVMPSGIAGLKFIDEAEAVNRSARELRARGVKAIVAVFHEGGELGSSGQRADWNDTSCPGAHGPIFEIASRLSRDIGVIFSAHTHQGYRCIVDGRLIIQATSYGRGVSVVDLMLDPKTRDIDAASTRSTNLPVVNERTEPAVRERLAHALPAPYGDALLATQPDAAIASKVAEYAALVAPKAERPVGQIAASYTRRNHQGDSSAGRLIADAQLAATRAPEAGGAQIAFMNQGGIRSDLECSSPPPCTVSFGQIFTMQPFGNSLVVMSLSGAQIKALLEAQQRGNATEPTFLQASAGFSYTWQADAPAGQRVRDMTLDGAPVQAGQTYRVTVSNFLAEGGDGFAMLRQGRQQTGGMQDVEALAAYLKRTAVNEPVAEPRIKWAR